VVRWTISLIRWLSWLAPWMKVGRLSAWERVEDAGTDTDGYGAGGLGGFEDEVPDVARIAADEEDWGSLVFCP
jgi:hypothetical protein